MSDTRLGPVEARFANIIWDNAPLPSGELVKKAEAELGWKKSTTYTILRRMCQRGLFKNQDGTVSVLISREEFAAMQSSEFVEESFGGSLPAFMAAFTSKNKLTEAEIDELHALIDKSRGGVL